MDWAVVKLGRCESRGTGCPSTYHPEAGNAGGGGRKKNTAFKVIAAIKTFSFLRRNDCSFLSMNVCVFGTNSAAYSPRSCAGIGRWLMMTAVIDRSGDAAFDFCVVCRERVGSRGIIINLCSLKTSFTRTLLLGLFLV